jgi:membrane protein YdbS with pleckstrin-like domain
VVENAPLKSAPAESTVVPGSVERTDPDGVDYGRVMQLTFVVTVLVGVPVVAVLSLSADLPTWSERAAFAVRVGAVVWMLVAVSTYVLERRAVE